MTLYSRNPAVIRKYIEDQGVIFCYDVSCIDQIKRCFAKIGQIFPELTNQISLFFCYDQAEQTEADSKESDSIIWFHTPPYSNTLLAIGVSVAAVSQGEDYLFLCLLHELAHMRNISRGKHDSVFHVYLDELISCFNAATGKNIKNDYHGLEFRYDSSHYTLCWEGVPKETPSKGKEFRYG